MADNYFKVGATLDIGFEREKQEDFVQFYEIDEDNLFCVIADGTGSQYEHLQPAPIIVMEIIKYVQRLCDGHRDQFFEDPCFHIKMAMECSNRIIGALKMGNEEMYSGYAASVTCCLCSHNTTTDNIHIYVGHAGNTRLYLIRDGIIKRLTEDDTKAFELLKEGSIDLETYHLHPLRLQMTSGIGVVSDPDIQTFKGKLRDKDLLVMTTDGVHYAIREEYIARIVLESDDVEAASGNLIAGSRMMKYPDNSTAMVIRKNGNLS